MNEYKEDIINTRKGCLGGSDAKLLQQIAELGCVPRSAYKRMAIVNGLCDNKNITTRAMQYGDFIEQSIYAHLAECNSEYQSNPLWVSDRYSKKNCKLICHPDIIYFDHDKRILNVWEVKATKFAVKPTKELYREQMYIEWLLAKEQAAKVGKRWSVRVCLAHYNTEGVDINEEFSFEPERLTIHKMNFKEKLFDVDKAMSIVDDFLEGFNEYYEDEEIDYQYLPSNVQKQFDLIATTLMEIKERERTVNEFKERLYDFLQEKGIKSIKSDMFSVVLVNPSEAASVDYKTLFIEEIESKKPRVAYRLKEKYKKITKRNGYVTIKIKK